MKTLRRILSSVALLATLVTPLPACSQDVEIGAYPTRDDRDVSTDVSKEEAADVAAIALQGLNDADYAAWTMRWDGSMLDAVSESAWLEMRTSFFAEYGRFEEILETRLTEADEEGAVRFSFLVRFQRADLVLVHVYPADGDQIIGVHMRRPDGSDL